MFNDVGASAAVTNTGFCNNTPDQIDGDPIVDGGGNSLLYCPPPIAKSGRANPTSTAMATSGLLTS
jgi:hypothetical protein